jgi:2-phosphoglycerate kinase
MSIRIIHPDGAEVPFSKGILSQQLVAVGVQPDIAYQTAEQVENDLRSIGHVEERELSSRVGEYIATQVSAEAADRWARWSLLKEEKIPFILLITGGNGTGKSTLAAQLGLRMGINRLTSTDSIREVMRELSVQALVPQLYQSSYRVAPPPGARSDDAIAGFTQQAYAVNIGVQAIINRAVKEKTSVIIEGIHLLPSIAATVDPERYAVIPVTLIVPDAREHYNRFSLREAETAGDRPSADYLPYFKQIRAIHDYLVNEALANNHTLIDATDIDRSVPLVIDQIMKSLEGVIQRQTES